MIWLSKIAKTPLIAVYTDYYSQWSEILVCFGNSVLMTF